MNKGHILSTREGLSKAVTGILRRCLDEKICDAVLVMVRSNGGYNYVLAEDSGLLQRAEIMPPVMPVQGGKVVLSLTRHGKSGKIMAVMRPCEIRAAVELSKLRQTDLENIIFISMDCYGVMPLSDYIQGSTEETETELRPLCRICENFSLDINDKMQAVDLHIGSAGVREGSALVIPVSTEGKEILQKLGMEPEEDITDWSAKSAEIRHDRQKARGKALAELKEKVCGLDGLLETFSQCIECHNCRSVCPICYCRLCFADRGTSADTADSYVQRAESRGALRILPEPLLFHIGRMSHMSLSCVSCGMCEDACPMDIPVGQIFSITGEATRDIFDYLPGRSTEEKLPCVKYELEELSEIEDR